MANYSAMEKQSSPLSQSNHSPEPASASPDADERDGAIVSRREFLGIACVAGVSLLTLVGCNSASQTDSGSPGGEQTGGAPAGGAPAGGAPAGGATPVVATANADGTFTVPGAGNPQPGTGIVFSLPGGKGPGIIFAPQAGQLHALSARCTHSGCTVKVEDGNPAELFCPCHRSRFDVDGKVLGGPAKAPLPVYQVKASGNDAIVTISA